MNVNLSVLESVRRRSAAGSLGMWEKMNAAELDLLADAECAQKVAFERFDTAQPPLGEFVGVLLSDGARCLGEFVAPYTGEAISAHSERTCVGWMVAGDVAREAPMREAFDAAVDASGLV